MKHLPFALVVVLLLLMAVLAGGAVLHESITIDEVAHIGAGVSYLQRLDMRMNEEHPPLAKLLAALPLVLHGVRTDYADFSWTFSSSWFNSFLGEWVWGNSVAVKWNDPGSLLVWARAPMLLLTLALGACIYVFGSRLGNTWGGFLCVVAFVTTPAFLTFGPLVLTDIAVTLFCLLTLWSFATLWSAPNRRNMLSFGLLLGAALLTKFSAGLLLFCFLFFRLSLRWLPVVQLPADKSELRQWRRLRGRYLWAGILVASISVYVVYFIFTWNQPSDSLQILGSSPASLLLRRILMAPSIYLRGLAGFALSAQRATFLLDHYYTHGVWFYFPALFVLKSTLASLLMLVAAPLVALVARAKLKSIRIIPDETALHWRAVCVSLLVFTGGCMLSPMTISIRHFSVPIVLLILLLAPVPRALELLHENRWPAARPVMGAYAVLAVLSLVTVLRAFPHFFPFFNSLGFGQPGYNLAGDSNLDWNQALPEVEEFVAKRGLQHVLLDEYGFVEPSVYIPQAQFWNCQAPDATDAGQIAIVSASMIRDGHNCPWLLNYPREELVAGGMYAFQLPTVIPPVGGPAGPPPPETHRNFGGFPGPDVRIIFLKCLRDPTQLQPTVDKMRAQFEAEVAKRKAQQKKN